MKNILNYLKDSIREILFGSFLALLSISGLIAALITRFLDFSGSLILLIAIIVELIGMLGSYMIFKTFLIEEEESINKKKAKNAKKN